MGTGFRGVAILDDRSFQRLSISRCRRYDLKPSRLNGLRLNASWLDRLDLRVGQATGRRGEAFLALAGIFQRRARLHHQAEWSLRFRNIVTTPGSGFR